MWNQVEGPLSRVLVRPQDSPFSTWVDYRRTGRRPPACMSFEKYASAEYCRSKCSSRASSSLKGTFSNYQVDIRVVSDISFRYQDTSCSSLLGLPQSSQGFPPLLSGRVARWLQTQSKEKFRASLYLNIIADEVALSLAEGIHVAHFIGDVV